MAGFWRGELGDLPDWLYQVVLDYAPPVSIRAVENVQSWINDPRLDFFIEKFRQQDIPEALPRALYTRYPLFAAHLRLAEFGEGQDDLHQLLGDTLGGHQVPEESDGVKPETYYADCLVLRKAIALMRDQSTTSSDLLMLERLINRLESASDGEGLAPTDQSRCLRLLRGERLPGTPSHTRVAPHDSGHLTRIPRASTPPTTRHEFLPSPAESGVSSPDDEPIPDYHRTASSKSLAENLADTSPLSRQEPSDPDKPDEFRRRNADFRTRGDDRHALGQLPWLQSVQNTRSPADIHRLPLEHVAEAIRGLHQRKKFTEWAFAWMLATTAMPVHRLAKLTKYDSMPADQATIESIPRVIMEDARLEIPLSDGPSGPPGSDNRVARLPLPSGLIELLGAIEADQPFLQAAGYADLTLRRHFQRFPGLMPTCQRIRATAEAVIQGLAPDSVTGLTLKGDFGHSSRGAAAYRRTADQDLVDLFHRVSWHWRSKNLIPNLANLGAFPVPAISPYPPLDGYVGSSKVGTCEQFQAVFRHLEHEIDRLVKQTHREKGSSGVEIHTLLDLQHAHAQLTYLAFLLSTGIRPISTRATIRLAGSYWYVQDKDSPGFSERRALPALPEIVDQVLEQRAFTRMLCNAPPLRRLRL
ncbi:hypothetical protein P8631_11790, partial [Guyparkeria sp. 1SP6A2]|nr:hypothetical protein [Guyparkeria sp. 1SP6A2]